MKSLPAFAFASAIGLAACAAPEPVPAPGAGEAAITASCNASAAQSAVGKIATREVVEEARVAAGAQVARTLKPGQVVTMEYHASRLNLHVDDGNVVTRVACG